MSKLDVRVKHHYAGPHGTCAAGHIISLPAKVARALVAEGQAEWVRAPAPEPAVAEVAMDEPKAERAVATPQRKKRGRRVSGE